MRRTTMAALGLLLATAACNQDEATAPPSTTATTAAVTSSPATTGATAQQATTTVVPRELPAYRVVERVSTDQGETLVLLLEPADYDDLDIENLMIHVVDEYGPTSAHVVDDQAAVELVLAGQTSGGLLDQHYLARLEDGNRVVFAGPLAEFGWFLVGS